jgi:mRNA interferase MazF
MQNEIYVVGLDPTKGAEMQKTRPCVVISPDEMNDNLKTVVVAPLTGTIKGLPFRPETSFNGKTSSIALDHIRSIDKLRLLKRVGTLSDEEVVAVKTALNHMFQ